MSGYAGPDLESEHALILSENGIEASRVELRGQVLTECNDCGNTINPKRVEFLRSKDMKCERCVVCQSIFDAKPKRGIKMLDRIL